MIVVFFLIGIITVLLGLFVAAVLYVKTGYERNEITATLAKLEGELLSRRRAAYALVGQRDEAANVARSLRSEITKLRRDIESLKAGKTFEIFEIGSPVLGDRHEDFLVVWNADLGTVDAKLAARMAGSIWERPCKVRVWASSVERIYRALESKFPSGQGFRYYSPDVQAAEEMGMAS